MSESKTSERRLAAVEKQRLALELRKAGVSFPQIAAQLGYKSVSGAFDAVDSAIKRLLQEPAEEVRKLEVARLDHMLSAVWPSVQRGDERAVEMALKIMARRAKLLGLDAPKAVELSGDLRLSIDALDKMLADAGD